MRISEVLNGRISYVLKNVKNDGKKCFLFFFTPVFWVISRVVVLYNERKPRVHERMLHIESDGILENNFYCHLGIYCGNNLSSMRKIQEDCTNFRGEYFAICGNFRAISLTQKTYTECSTFVSIQASFLMCIRYSWHTL